MRHLVVKNGNFRFLLLKLMQADQVRRSNPPVEASSGQEWKFQISIVKAHVGRSSGRSTPLSRRHLVAKNVNFQFLLLKLIQTDQVADLTPQQRHLVTKNGNFRFLLLKLTQADQVADLSPVEASSGQEWQFQISMVKAYIDRSSGRSTPQQRHLVVKNGNFRFLLLKLIQTDQVADLPLQVRGIQW